MEKLASKAQKNNNLWKTLDFSRQSSLIEFFLDNKYENGKQHLSPDNYILITLALSLMIIESMRNTKCICMVVHLELCES